MSEAGLEEMGIDFCIGENFTKFTLIKAYNVQDLQKIAERLPAVIEAQQKFNAQWQCLSNEERNEANGFNPYKPNDVWYMSDMEKTCAS